MENLQQRVEVYRHEEEVLAIVVRHGPCPEGIHFLTPETFPQQLGFMKYRAGKAIQPHVHKPLRREVLATQEVLFIKKGKLRVNLYTEDRKPVEDFLLGEGDVILLAGGGHGFEIVEDIEMFEVKQGPYAGEADKVRFEKETL